MTVGSDAAVSTAGTAAVASRLVAGNGRAAARVGDAVSAGRRVGGTGAVVTTGVGDCVRWLRRGAR